MNKLLQQIGLELCGFIFALAQTLTTPFQSLSQIFGLPQRRRAAGSVQGFGVFAVIIFASFWIGSAFLAAVNFNTTEGLIAMFVGALFPIAIGYFAWIRFGKKYDTS